MENTLKVADKIIEWNASKENDPEFLIKYYESRIIYWSKYEHISKKIIDKYRKKNQQLKNKIMKTPIQESWVRLGIGGKE